VTGAEKHGNGIRRFGAHLALIGAALLGLFALLELGFRLATLRDAGPRPGQGWAIHDEELGYRPRPHFADQNELGLRDDPIAARKTRFRVLMLGDSVTAYGETSADTYPGQLEGLLNRDPARPPVEVINAGVRGYTNYQELLFLKKIGLALEPDLVGVGFVLNDLHRILHRFALEDGEIVGDEYTFTDEATESVGSPLYRLARSSRFLVWLRHRLGVFDRLIELYSGDGFVFDYRPDFSSAWRPESWGPIEEQLAELVELGGRHGFGVFLVAFPFGEQLRDDYLARDAEYVTLPQRTLRALCESLAIPYLDLLPLLEREIDLQSDGIHLTQRGREKVAARIAVFLEEERLIPVR
jgi:lysophospholipase L1-like esterase